MRGGAGRGRAVRGEPTYPAQGEKRGALKPNNWLYLPVAGEKGMQYFRITQVGRTSPGWSPSTAAISATTARHCGGALASHSSENYSAVPFFAVPRP